MFDALVTSTRIYQANPRGMACTPIIGVARGGQGRAFALPSLNFALPSKVAKQVN